MISLVSGHHRCIGGKRVVDSGVGNKVGLELIQVNIQSSFKPQGGCDGGNNLSNETIKVGVGWPRDLQISSCNVIDCLNRSKDEWKALCLSI